MQFFSLGLRLRQKMKRCHVCFATQYLLIYCLGGQKNLGKDIEDQGGGATGKAGLEVGGKKIKLLASNACLPQAGSAPQASSEALWIIFLLQRH
jgi:hypothetical protein